MNLYNFVSHFFYFYLLLSRSFQKTNLIYGTSIEIFILSSTAEIANKNG